MNKSLPGTWNSDRNPAWLVHPQWRCWSVPFPGRCSGWRALWDCGSGHILSPGSLQSDGSWRSPQTYCTHKNKTTERPFEVARLMKLAIRFKTRSVTLHSGRSNYEYNLHFHSKHSRSKMNIIWFSQIMSLRKTVFCNNVFVWVFLPLKTYFCVCINHVVEVSLYTSWSEHDHQHLHFGNTQKFRKTL